MVFLTNSIESQKSLFRFLLSAVKSETHRIRTISTCYQRNVVSECVHSNEKRETRFLCPRSPNISFYTCVHNVSGIYTYIYIYMWSRTPYSRTLYTLYVYTRRQVRVTRFMRFVTIASVVSIHRSILGTVAMAS